MNQNSSFPFEGLDFSEKQLILRGLIALVKSNSGFGFCNNDQGHPAYAVGRQGEFDFAHYGDSPEHNKLFKLMHTLSVDLSSGAIDGSSEIVDFIFSWADFCLLGYSAREQPE